VTAGPLRAGSAFAATVSARNAAGGTTPNFGREGAPETATLAWVRIQPTGNGASNGSFSGSLGAFSSGSATATNLVWSEVGRGDLLARTANAGGYLGTGLRAFGSSAGTGARWCAAERSSCALPGGTTATVYYGENGSYTARTGQTGNISCDNSVFTDPLFGVTKACWYAPTSATSGSVGSFIPHRFTVVAPNSCGAFTYAGQPATATVTAQNAAGNTTVNFDGTAATTPTFAQAVTLSDINALGLGTLSGAAIAASAFSAGVATSQVSYAFTTKTTAPQSLVLRATNGGSGSSLISSQGHAEPTLPLRSGRLRLSNAFGRSAAALQLPVVTEYWGGTAWLLNSADNCTALAGSSVALSNPRGSSGGASTATSSAGALAISGGNGSITLAAPSPAGSTLSLDVAVNLGSTATDQSCHASHPATTGAARPWLRAQNGSCAATDDRDPAARASFGIYSPETRKTVHVRELF
jgi:MSHA biogenesis protein MshQ